MIFLLSMVFTTYILQLGLGVSLPVFFSIITLKVLNIMFAVTILLVILVLVLENDNPVHTLAWILVLLYIPVVGFFFYLFFGRNWRKTRLYNRKGLADAINLHELWPAETHNCANGEADHLGSRLINLLDSNSKAILTCNNKVSIIPDTNTALDMICTDIAAAKRHIHLEYFSISNDESGRRLRDLLIQKAQEGVEVRFIYDDVGCWDLGKRFKRSLLKAGVSFVPFMPVWVPFLNSRLNYRNHRKLVVIDGEKGYLGGLNVGNKYFGLSRYYGYWRDSVVLVEGEGAVTLQAIFLTDWFFVSKQNLLKHGLFNKYAPDRIIEKADSKVPLQIAASGPDSDHASILQAYFMAISNARRCIRVETPYLILNDSLLMAFKTAALSGVRIQIILPGKPDHLIVWWGSKSYYRELLEAGVEIYEYQNGFLHAKVLIVDEEVMSIGTANMDLRSFNHNFEITAMIYSPQICAQAIAQFDHDLSLCRQITLQEYIKRPLVRKSIESVCRLFSPLL